MNRIIKAHLLDIALIEEVEKLMLIPKWIRLMQAAKWNAQRQKLQELAEKAEHWRTYHQVDGADVFVKLRKTIEIAKRNN